MSDDFFDDEQELMEAKAAPVSASAPAPAKNTRAAEPASSEKAARQNASRQAPPFWMVLAIAIIALLLGVVIGYLLGTSATLAQLSESASAATSQTTSEATSGVELPEGHPQLDIADDGTATVAGSDAGSASE